MRVIGLTGSIATGKSTVAAMLGQFRIPVFDADRAVHAMLQPKAQAFAQIALHFPHCIINHSIDRRALGNHIFADDSKRLLLEAILHPLVRNEEIAFIRRHQRMRSPLAVLDIPLLYETGADRLCDQIWLTDCPPFLQRQRALSRPFMTEEKYRAIIRQQMPQTEKRRRADIILPTGLSRGFTMRAIQAALIELCRGSA